MQLRLPGPHQRRCDLHHMPRAQVCRRGHSQLRRHDHPGSSSSLGGHIPQDNGRHQITAGGIDQVPHRPGRGRSCGGCGFERSQETPLRSGSQQVRWTRQVPDLRRGRHRPRDIEGVPQARLPVPPGLWSNGGGAAHIGEQAGSQSAGVRRTGPRGIWTSV